MSLIYCECCKLEVPPHDWDGTYGCCHQCAFCASLEHFPCCHGGCCKHVEPPPVAFRWKSPAVRELLAGIMGLVTEARGVIACV